MTRIDPSIHSTAAAKDFGGKLENSGPREGRVTRTRLCRESVCRNEEFPSLVKRGRTEIPTPISGRCATLGES